MKTDKIPVEERVFLKDLHFDHEVWANELEFYKNEITIFNRRLEEIVQKYTKKEVLMDLEKFQNQYIRQKEVIDELAHKIRIHEQALARYAKEHPIAIEHQYFRDHTSLRDEYEIFVKIYQELKTDFMRFLAKWM